MNLQQFCSRDEARPQLMKPWSIGEHTIATNGHIMIRVPRVDDVPENADAPPTHKVWARCDMQGEPLEVMQCAIPTPVMETCMDCAGSKKKHVCPSCNCPCPDCDGTGEVEINQDTSVGFFGVPIDLRYARMILALPKVRFFKPTGRENPLPFKFEGGDGCVMPLRREKTNHITAKLADS